MFEQLALKCARTFESARVWPLIEKAYTQTPRIYHGLAHLQAMFDFMEPYLKSSSHARSIEMSVFFHDFVYDTRPALYPKNEMLSALALLSCTGQEAPQLWDCAALAATFIRATQHHDLALLTATAEPEKHAACALFLDADLAVLASDAARFNAYEQGILLEWGQDPLMPSASFKAGRAKALSALLEKPSIFYCEQFKHLEAKARENLQSLLAERYTD